MSGKAAHSNKKCFASSVPPDEHNVQIGAPASQNLNKQDWNLPYPDNTSELKIFIFLILKRNEISRNNSQVFLAVGIRVPPSPSLVSNSSFVIVFFKKFIRNRLRNFQKTDIQLFHGIQIDHQDCLVIIVLSLHLILLQRVTGLKMNPTKLIMIRANRHSKYLVLIPGRQI